MESPPNLETIAQKVITRAKEVSNERTDFFSQMARGVLYIEQLLAGRVLENEKSKVELPGPLEAVEKGQERFFNILRGIKEEIMLSLLRQHPSWAPELLPEPIMCGYTSSAITEALRRRGVVARVVYGHYRNNGEVRYHYWTEAHVEGQEFAIDATYGQFDPGLGERILIYPSSDLGKYGLKEYKAEDAPVFGDGDINMLGVLAANDGVLPMREYIQVDSQRQKYEELTEVLAQEIYP